MRPVLCEEGHVVIVTYGWPPTPGGSSILMYNLLDGFDPDSFTIVTADIPHNKGIVRQSHRIERVLRQSKGSGRLVARTRDLQWPGAALRTRQIIQRTNACVVVAAYPDIHLLAAARWAAKSTKTPMVAYLHDTVAESNAQRFLYNRLAARLQRQVLDESEYIFVMSEGMRDLYRDQYGVETTPLEHTYMEDIPTAPPTHPPERCALWAGDVYGINQRALGRVSRALGKLGIPLEVASHQTLDDLAAKGIKGDHVRTAFYSGRKEYLEAVASKAVLLLALDAPHESNVHRDELATIFPTKTPEYLASGRPVFAHCPSDYFLARFLNEHGCGAVVSEDDDNAIMAQLGELFDQHQTAQALGAKALEAAHRFRAGPLRERFQRVIQDVARRCA